MSVEKLAEEHKQSLNVFGKPLRGDDDFKPNLNCGEIRNLCTDSFISGYNAANEWVSVDVVEPPKGKSSLFFTGGLVCVLYHGLDDFFYTGTGDEWTSPITHWMPLPKNPPTKTDKK